MHFKVTDNRYTISQHQNGDSFPKVTDLDGAYVDLY